MNDLLTQGLASGSPISFLTQGLIGELLSVKFLVECLSIVFNFQLAAMEIAIANPSIEILSPFNSIALDATNNQISIEVSAPTIDLPASPLEVILNVAASCPTA